MSKKNISRFFNDVQKSLTKHSPEILIGIGIAGMVTTTVLAVRATPKALEKCEEVREKHEGEPPKIEYVKAAWKCYIPAAVTGVVSAGCIIGANSINAGRTAALAAAYKLSETAFDDYREKVVETIGEKKERTVRDKVAEKQVKNNPVSKNDVIVTGLGDSLCLDPMSGRYFFSTIEKIKAAENKLNKQMIHDFCGYASLNDFYDEINLSHTDIGDILGWNTDRLIDIDISAQVSDDGRPSLVLVYNERPEYDYER